MSEQNDEHLLDECKRIEEDCLYTAEAHYNIAARANKVSFWVKFVPALVAAVSGIAVLNGAPNWVAWFSVLAAVAFTVQSILNPDKAREDHSWAAKNYTSLKHEAIALYKTFYHEMDHENFSTEVKILRAKYNTIATLTPQTTKKAFEEARKRIKAGRHTPDFEENQNDSD